MIRALVRLAAVTALCGLCACTRSPPDMSGTWKTSTGTMTLRQAGDQVSGVYELPAGAFRGVRRGGDLSGFWTQVTSNRDCGVERDGSRFWGRFALRVSGDGRHFAGVWAYCDDKPEFASGGVWVGERLRP